MWDHEPPQRATWGNKLPDFYDPRMGNCNDGHAWVSAGTVLRPAHCFRCDALKCRLCDEAMAAVSEGGFCEVHEVDRVIE